MVTTRSTAGENAVAPDPLAAIAAKLDTLDELREKVTALEMHSREHDRRKGRRWADDRDDKEAFPQHRPPIAKFKFPKFSGGDPRGWVLKAEKFFRYYATPEDDRVEIAAMYLEGDALDLFSWVNAERTLLYWVELVRTLTEHFGPPEYLNPDEHLCNILQTGTIQEYRQEWARRVARVTNWPEHCLLGVFLHRLQEDIRSEVRIHKPRSVYRAASLALEFEKKTMLNRGPKPISFSTWSALFPESLRAQEVVQHAPIDDPTRNKAAPRVSVAGLTHCLFPRPFPCDRFRLPH